MEQKVQKESKGLSENKKQIVSCIFSILMILYLISGCSMGFCAKAEDYIDSAGYNPGRSKIIAKEDNRAWVAVKCRGKGDSFSALVLVDSEKESPVIKSYSVETGYSNIPKFSTLLQVEAWYATENYYY